ncbi:MAG: C-GCAxxG-C-C family protein [Eubacteriales bacterium]
MNRHDGQARALFERGYNCAQAVFAAFCELTGLPAEAAVKMAAPFGGGMGRLREVCGAVSGMLLAAGCLYGYTDPADEQGKAAHYALVQSLVLAFRQAHGTLQCSELLKRPPDIGRPVADGRDAAFYAVRPCARLVTHAAQLLDEYIAEHPPQP